MTRGKRWALLRGLFLYHDRFKLWDDCAKIARHEPAAAELFQQFDDAVVTAFFQSVDANGAIRDLKDERSARGRFLELLR